MLAGTIYPAMRTNGELIRVAMDKCNLSYQNVADLLDASPHAVHAWLKPETSKSHNPAPRMAVELLYVKCGLDLPKYAQGATLKDVRGG